MANGFRKYGPDLARIDPNLELRVQAIEAELQRRALASNLSATLDPNENVQRADPEQIPPAPTGLSLISNINNTLTAEWDHVAIGNLLHYEVDFAEDEAFADTLLTKIVKDNFIEFNDATVAVTNYVRLRAISQTGVSGDYSPTLNAATGQVTSADIDTDAVTTPKFAANAATIPVNAQTAGSITISSTSDTTIQSVTYTTVGADVQLSFWAYSDDIDPLDAGSVLKLKRNGVTLIEIENDLRASYDLLLAYAETPPAGSVTYTVTAAKFTSGTDFTVVNRILWLIETKR